jgi:hypothetical protein
MNKEELISQAERIIVETERNPFGGLTQAKEFLKMYVGKESTFFIMLDKLSVTNSLNILQSRVRGVLQSFIKYAENDLIRNISIEREIQIETVSDFLEQANSLLNSKKVHPAAPAVLIGASLEEFLRNWLEEDGFDLNSIKNSLDGYSSELRKQEKITKQDLKDIVSWGGTRNDAAHGHWTNVEDRNRIKLMLEGVNLFMRKYSVK